MSTFPSSSVDSTMAARRADAVERFEPTNGGDHRE